jgi:gliding motility-associated protein GldE
VESIDPDPLPEPLLVMLTNIFTDFPFEEIFTLLILIVLLIASGLVSGSETAFFSLDPADIEKLKSHKSKAKNKVLRLLQKPKKLLATILIANNFINVGIVIISTYLTTLLVSQNSDPLIVFLIQVVLITSVLLIFGEIIPKILANKKSIEVALFMAMPLDIMLKIFKPLSSGLVASTSFIDKKIGDKGHNITMSDLTEAIEMTIDENAPEEEKMILKGIANFGDKEASEIMQSRMDILAISEDTPFQEMMKIAIESGFSRIPVYHQTIDKVLGILYIKDLLPFLNTAEKKNWTDLLRPVFYVPENKKINDLLQDFRKKKIHLAIVVDEYGGTSGIITLEDIIEEIVGEISDEFDEEEDDKYQKISENVYLFEAKTPINDFCKILNIDDEIFNDVIGESDSLGGLLLEMEGRIPKKGNITKFKHFDFKITNADQRKIIEIEITINKEENQDED